MTSPKNVEHIQYLIQSAQLEEAQTELANLLGQTPRNEKAWAIAAQLTSDRQQRKQFLRRVFEFSDDADLADWAFRNLGEQLSDKPPDSLSIPPIEALMVRGDARIPLDDLLVHAMPKDQPISCPADKVPPAPSLIDHERQANRRHLSFSVKWLGKWIMIVGGIIFITSVYYKPLLAVFVVNRLSPFYHCFVPLFLLGVFALLVGFVVDKK
jgi:hypothetical protein